MTGDPITDVFLTLAILLGVVACFGAAARRLGQPAVIGEILAGVLVGPALLPHSVTSALMPADAKPAISALGNVGLAAFMCVMGHGINNSRLRPGERTAVGLAIGSSLVPLAGGILVALPLAGTYAPGDHTAFVLFVGVAVSVTALPVLARILADRGLTRAPLSGTALTAAAIGDLFAWACLAGVLVLAHHSDQWRLALLPLYLVAFPALVRPLLSRVLSRSRRKDTAPALLFPLFVAGLVLSGAAAEWLGIHFIFGAFAFGWAMPAMGRDHPGSRVLERMEITSSWLLPLYFVLAGANVAFSGAVGLGTLVTLLAVLAVAIGTKAIGAYAGARAFGAPHDDAFPLAVLMNTRGLTEIVVLSVALQARLIDPTFYSIMVVVALVTTAMTGPVLRFTKLRTPPPHEEAPDEFQDGPGRAVPVASRADDPAGHREGPL
ncbi:cation:proton antiporter [Streptomyces sp. 8L]|uniref:cation:proton antiporter n=1 Tax=Streptomyces sp. 8L TaxID=2877242 RepID=UPI001CD7EC39|nr:cation:proton antiporter [Streptomyces sp. 8L]MCA1222138.1 cation:proton antiporter [Streptomyces sp. 8L]